jgi:hypothetical protein
MYRRDTPNEFARVRTSLGSRKKIFQTGGTAWGGSDTGSGLVSIWLGPPGSTSSTAWRRFALGLRTHFNGSGSGSGGGGDDDLEGRFMSKSKTGDDEGGGASGKSKLFSFE